MSQGLLCGDEVRAAVIDLGSHRCRFGSAGQDSPRHIFRTDIGIKNGNEMENNDHNNNNNYIIGDSNLRVLNNTIDIDHPYQLIDSNSSNISSKNYDINMNEVEALLQYGLTSCMKIDPQEYPLYLAEGPFNKKQKEELIEIIFETFNSPAMYMSSNAMLSSFCVGKPTSLVVDCGYSETRITPVIDGYSLKKSAIVTSRGGRWIDSIIKQEIESNINNPIMRPWYEVHKKLSKNNIIPTQSYRNMAINDIITDLKQHMCFVPWKVINPDERADRMSKLNLPPYELPDGTFIPYYDALSTVPEKLYTQKSKKRPRPGPNNDKPSFLQDVDCSIEEDSLSELVYGSLIRSDVDTRRDLLSNIILVGGGSNIDGMSQRLANDLNELLPEKMKCKVSTPGSGIERNNSAWIGGSILSICGSFQQLWLSNAEYKELGTSIIDMKITH